MAAQGDGYSTIDFGLPAAPTDYVTLVITDQVGIVNDPSTQVEAWMMSQATTDHNEEEHQVTAGQVALTCGAVVTGVGFTIYAVSDILLDGQFWVRWVWKSP